MICCILCRKELSVRGLDGHRRAIHQRGTDQRARSKGDLLPREATSELLREIDAFCFKTGMSDSEFGAGAVFNTAFVKSLRLDRPRLYESIVRKARAFMARSK